MIVPQKIPSTKPHILDSHEVWYSSFWSEGPINHFNHSRSHGAAPWDLRGTNFETKIVRFRWFLGFYDQKKLYHNQLLSKIWGFSDKKNYGTIPSSSQIPPLVYDVGGPVVDGACNRFGGKPIAEAGAECQWRVITNHITTQLLKKYKYIFDKGGVQKIKMEI